MNKCIKLSTILSTVLSGIFALILTLIIIKVVDRNSPNLFSKLGIPYMSNEVSNKGNNKIYITIFDYLKDNTPCYFSGVDNIMLREVYANQYNLLVLLRQCEAYKNKTLSPEYREKIKKAILKGAKLIISSMQFYRMYDTIGMRQKGFFKQIAENANNSTGAQDDRMINYYRLFNKQLNLSKVTFYLDGKEYTLLTKKLDKMSTEKK